ncbi:MAG: STAS domain-containing protein [Planctomycetes bacterium]|nr:STAS domain-containing protein [Planctomycetota bacterium]
MEIRLDIHPLGEILIVKALDKRIHYEESEDFGDQVQKALDESGFMNLLLDLQEVEYITTNALGRLIGIHKRIVEKKGQLKIVLTHKGVLEIFKITNLNKVLQIYPSKEKALKSFERPG